MGGKSSPEIPERYELEELLKYNTDLNRFDAVNPFGSQRWSVGEDGRWTMTQAPSPELEKMMNSQYDFVSAGPSYYETPRQLDSAFQRLSGNMMRKHGNIIGYSPDIPSSSPPLPSSYAQDRSEAPPEVTGGANAAAEVVDQAQGPMGPQGNSESINSPIANYGSSNDPNSPNFMGPPDPGRGIDWAAGGEALTAAAGYKGLGESVAKIAEAMRNRRGGS